ncbi:MAG: hypothetical protein IPK15_19135 [Verrucomicrobia bacterium]|nr:hypothetical protein [Verrucomicrobiota bacterium]
MCNSRESAKRIAAIGALARLVPFHAAARDAVKSVAERINVHDRAPTIKAPLCLKQTVAPSIAIQDFGRHWSGRLARPGVPISHFRDKQTYGELRTERDVPIETGGLR